MREIAVAQLTNSDLRPYRLPFLQMLRERRPDISLTLYVGQALPGFGAPTEPLKDVPVPVKRVVNHFWPKGRHRVAWQSGALAVLRSEARVIICEEVVYNLTVWLIRLLHRRFGKRLILLGFMTREPGNGPVAVLRRALLRWLRSSADALISYTDSGRRALEADGTSMEKVFVSYNTVDTAALEAISQSVSEHEIEELRTQLGIERPVVLFVGKLIPEKRVDVIIEALKEMAHPPALIVVGDGPERARLESMVVDVPVLFTGAIYDDHVLARYLALSEFVVLPGRVGLTCVHGFAAGRPCITTGSGGVAQTPEFEYVADGENAIVVPRPQPQLHAEAVSRLLADPELLVRLRRGAIATARQLRMDAMVDGFTSAIEHAVKSGPWAE
jgi:glycosyltransferase involved in cell wall biosynthesis